MTEAIASTPAASLGAIFTPEFIADPYPTYSFLQQSQPIFKVPDTNMWLLTKYQDIVALLRDKRFGHGVDLPSQNGSETLDECLEENASMRSLEKMMLLSNPPTHTRLRSLVVKAFNARSVVAMRAQIQAVANELLDKMVATDGGDLVQMFNHPLPVMVICEVLGIPKEDRSRFADGSQVNGRVIDPTPMTQEELTVANENTLESQAYFEQLFERRRQQPQDDLLTALVTSEAEHGKLSQEELTANVALLFAAGHETTANLLGNALLALYRHPEQLQLLRSNPDLMPAAAEEFLRYDSSVQLTGRTALEDVEFNGHHFAKGEQILTLLGAANRDPEQFEQPEKLNITRKDAKYLSFGGGIHFCLGATLARLEVAEALTLLFQRLPDLQLQNIDQPDWKDTITLRGLKTLPATW